MNSLSFAEYEASLKSIETENYIDRLIFRPIGFLIAKLLSKTCVTPNAVTIISIFIGVAAGPLFYFNNFRLILSGIICLLIANLLDCVDGQLARLTGKKSKIGRILDGIAGDVWFASIYIFLALRLQNEYDSGWFFLLALLSAISHLIQANITDYYKTLHLFFMSKEKGQEFQKFSEIRMQYEKMKSGIRKKLFFLYMGYTLFQEAVTPQLQKMLANLKKKFGDDIPEEIRKDFRRKSKLLMKVFIDSMTFNARAVVLFFAVISGYVWIYFFFEIVILNLILLISIYLHEKICCSPFERNVA